MVGCWAGGLLATAHLLALTASHFSKRGAMLGPEFVRRKLAGRKKSSCVVRPNTRDGGTL